MIKKRLLAPGPVEVPQPVLEAMARPVFLHRGAEFRELLFRVREKLARLACVPGEDVLVTTASGTAAFEAAMLAAVPRGAKIVALQAGKFGERWAQVARRHGYQVVTLEAEWGSTFTPGALAELLETHSDAAAVTTTHSETSTGVLHDVAELSRVTRSLLPDALVLVDAVTSLAAAELLPLEWDLDAVVSGSQKGLMTPPGLGVVWLSERAWRASERITPASYYLDLRKEREAQAKGQTAFTPAVSLVAGLDVALDLLLAEPPEALWARKALLNEAVLAGGEAIGFTPFAERVSPAVAALRVPPGVEAPAVVAGLRERGVAISGGQDHLKPTLVRPSLLGWADSFDAITLVAGLEVVSRELGVQVPHGAGVAAAMKVLEGTHGSTAPLSGTAATGVPL